MEIFHKKINKNKKNRRIEKKDNNFIMGTFFLNRSFLTCNQYNIFVQYKNNEIVCVFFFS